MTVEELREEAKKLGYNIVKDIPNIKLEPCPRCGSKRTIEWVHIDTDRGYTRECYVCEFRADRGSTKREARENWNKKVRECK